MLTPKGEKGGYFDINIWLADCDANLALGGDGGEDYDILPASANSPSLIIMFECSSVVFYDEIPARPAPLDIAHFSR
jgi:hypothetical protein